MTDLSYLFQPLTVGRAQLPNRFAMSCMAGGISLDRYGYPDDRMIAYYEERAKACPGMMGIGAGTVNRPIDDDRRTEKKVYSVVLYDDGCIAPLRRFTDTIRRYGTKFGIQLWDGGIQSGGLIQNTPSGIGSPFKAVGDQSEKSELKILSTVDIAAIVENFAGAAERCAQAGFDFALRGDPEAVRGGELALEPAGRLREILGVDVFPDKRKDGDRRGSRRGRLGHGARGQGGLGACTLADQGVRGQILGPRACHEHNEPGHGQPSHQSPSHRAHGPVRLLGVYHHSKNL